MRESKDSLPTGGQAAPPKPPAVLDDAGDILVTSSSPHVHCGVSVRGIMRDVILSLVPCTVAAVVFFGLRSLVLVAVCILSALATEWVCRGMMKRENALGDLSATVTGLLLALTLPVDLPLWQAVIGTVFAITIGKQVFGGLGYNPFNPALVGRAFLLISFTATMTTWNPSGWLSGDDDATLEQSEAVESVTSASGSFGNKGGVDATTTATPLGITKAGTKFGTPASEAFAYTGDIRWRLFIGDVNGSVGETSVLAILIGFAWLLIRRVIAWHTTVAYMGSMAIFTLVVNAIFPALAMPVEFHLMAGGALFGAVFMATDLVTSPVTRLGQVIFGAGCGVLNMIIRIVPGGAYPEGVTFAILIMNAFTPLINRATRYRRFGVARRRARTGKVRG